MFVPRRDVDAASVGSSVMAQSPRLVHSPTTRTHSNAGATAAAAAAAASGHARTSSGGTASNAAAGASSTGAEVANYRVFIRIRPFLASEADPSDGSFPIPPVELKSGREVVFIDTSNGLPRDVFLFDGCFCSITQQQWQQMADLIALPKESLPQLPPCATQEDVYNVVGQPIVDSVLEGFNTSILAYGQTSSGKTFSMLGTPQAEGLIPRIARAIMGDCARRVAEEALHDFEVHLSFFEIYNEAVLDLLQTGTAQHRKRKVRSHPTLGVFVDGLTLERVQTWPQCLRLLQRGLQLRHTAATRMNDSSSRSHAIFQLRVQQTEMTDIGPTQRRSNVYLADLAGSERVKLSAVEGDRLKEAAQINLSLTTLRRVIDALIASSNNSAAAAAAAAAAAGSSGGASPMLGPTSGASSSQLNSSATGRGLAPSPSLGPLGMSGARGSSGGGGSQGGGGSSPMVPYRDSMLTWVLSDSLGGNSKACMLATLCPHPSYAEETLNTLMYASRAKAIVNTVVKNEDQMAKMIRQLQDALAGKAAGPAAASPAAVAAASAAADSRIAELESELRAARAEAGELRAQLVTMRGALDASRERGLREEEAHAKAAAGLRSLGTKHTAATAEVQALRERAFALEVERKRLEEALDAAAADRSAIEVQRRVADTERKAADADARALAAERDALLEERARLQATVARLRDHADLVQSSVGQRLRDTAAAFQPMLRWYAGALATLHEAFSASARATLLTSVTSWSCDWALRAQRDLAHALGHARQLEATIRDLEVVKDAQDRALTQVALTYVDVRDFLHRAERGVVERTWTVAGIIASLSQFCAAARDIPTVALRAANVERMRVVPSPGPRDLASPPSALGVGTPPHQRRTPRATSSSVAAAATGGASRSRSATRPSVTPGR